MSASKPYPIGEAGQPWGLREKLKWLAGHERRRSYQDDVLSVIERLRPRYDVVEYGRLSFDPQRYPLHALKSRYWKRDVPCVLVTGGVHGYETSGVHGALRFLDRHAANYDHLYNIVVVPCVSPWAYETIQRWNPQAIDPNRSFVEGSPAEESAALVRLLAPLRNEVLVHVDLHETTDTDESEFRPALAARDGKPFEPDGIPDGFYVVDDSARPNTDFQRAIIAAVAKVTHIAPADADGRIIGSPVVAEGVIEYPLKELQLCAGITDAPFRTTTEVYPDSPRANPEQCIVAQVTAVSAAIEYALAHSIG